MVLQTEFPARYTLELAFPMFTPEWDPEHQYAIGLPLLYLDLDGDSAWNRGDEPLMGSAEEVLVVFAANIDDGVAAFRDYPPVLPPRGNRRGLGARHRAGLPAHVVQCEFVRDA